MAFGLEEAKVKKLIELLLELYDKKKLPVLKVLNEYSEIQIAVGNLINKGYLERIEQEEQAFYQLTEKGLEFVNEMINAAQKQIEEKKKEGEEKQEEKEKENKQD